MRNRQELIPTSIEDGLDRLQPLEARKGGGYIYHSDHSVPNNMSLQQYRRVIELVERFWAYGR